MSNHVIYMMLLLLLTLAQDDKAADEALDAFKGAMRSAIEAERVAAVSELSKVRHAKVLARLTPLLASDGPTVRMAAAKGLSEFADLRKPATTALLAAMPPNAKLPAVQASLLEAVGVLREPSALPALHRAFEEKETAVAKAAIAACGGFRSATSVEPLLELLKKIDKILKAEPGANVTAGNVNGYDVTARDDGERKRAQELRPVVVKALQEITGESFTAGLDWHAWWAKNKSSFRPK
jgi:HEAT repeat protein